MRRRCQVVIDTRGGHTRYLWDVTFCVGGYTHLERLCTQTNGEKLKTLFVQISYTSSSEIALFSIKLNLSIFTLKTEVQYHSIVFLVYFCNCHETLSLTEIFCHQSEELV